MSRLDKFEEILESYENIHVDAEAFKKDNPEYKEWLKKLDVNTEIDLEKTLIAIKQVVSQSIIGEHSPYYDTALYIVGSSVTRDDYDDIDIALVGMKQNYISDGLVDCFARCVQNHAGANGLGVAKQSFNGNHSAARIKFANKGKSIDFFIDRSGKTIKEWEYQQAVAQERYVLIGSLGRMDTKFSW